MRDFSENAQVQHSGPTLPRAAGPGAGSRGLLPRVRSLLCPMVPSGPRSLTCVPRLGLWPRACAQTNFSCDPSSCDSATRVEGTLCSQHLTALKKSWRKHQYGDNNRDPEGRHLHPLAGASMRSGMFAGIDVGSAPHVGWCGHCHDLGTVPTAVAQAPCPGMRMLPHPPSTHPSIKYFLGPSCQLTGLEGTQHWPGTWARKLLPQISVVLSTSSVPP